MNNYKVIKTKLNNPCQMWLDSKVDDMSIKSIYDINYDFPNNTDYHKYFLDPNQDQDIKASDKRMIKMVNCIMKIDDILDDSEDDEFLDIQEHIVFLNKHIQRYMIEDKSVEILIPPSSNRFHVNKMLNLMIDYVHENNMSYDVIDENGNSDKCFLVSKYLKNAFYLFCYDFTKRHINN